jgi:hypothetical protein
MSDPAEATESLAGATRELESIAALGYLLNAVAHDLNNQLTNLLLGADQIQYGGGADAAEMMVQQANRVAEITRAVQRLGQSNFRPARGPSDLGEIARAFGEWRRLTGRGAGDVIEVEDGLVTRADPTHLQRSLTMLADAFSEGVRPVRVTVRTEDMPRTVWSREGDTVSRAVLRLRVGDPSPEKLAAFKEVVDGFFNADRTDADIRLMAAWEIVRKQGGRMSVHGAPKSNDREVVLSFPLGS